MSCCYIPFCAKNEPWQSKSAAQVSYANALHQDIKPALQELVRAAADWQAAGLQRQGSNTGVCLRTNFRLMADIVVKQDGHLLVGEEKHLLESFQVAYTASQHSFTPQLPNTAGSQCVECTSEVHINGNKRDTNVLGDISPRFLVDTCHVSCSLSSIQTTAAGSKVCSKLT